MKEVNIPVMREHMQNAVLFEIGVNYNIETKMFVWQRFTNFRLGIQLHTSTTLNQINISVLKFMTNEWDVFDKQ